MAISGQYTHFPTLRFHKNNNMNSHTFNQQNPSGRLKLKNSSQDEGLDRSTTKIGRNPFDLLIETSESEQEGTQPATLAAEEALLTNDDTSLSLVNFSELIIRLEQQDVASIAVLRDILISTNIPTLPDIETPGILDLSNLTLAEEFITLAHAPMKALHVNVDDSAEADYFEEKKAHRLKRRESKSAHTTPTHLRRQSSTPTAKTTNKSAIHLLSSPAAKSPPPRMKGKNENENEKEKAKFKPRRHHQNSIILYLISTR